MRAILGSETPFQGAQTARVGIVAGQFQYGGGRVGIVEAQFRVKMEIRSGGDNQAAFQGAEKVERGIREALLRLLRGGQILDWIHGCVPRLTGYQVQPVAMRLICQGYKLAGSRCVLRLHL